MANRAVLTGRMTADPEIKQTPNGVSVTSFSIAVPKRFKKKGEKETDFLDIVAWRQTAEFVCNYFTKGKWIEVDGHLETRTWKDKDGKNRKSVEIIADMVDFVGDKPKENSVNGQEASAASAPVNTFPQDFDPDFTDADDEGDLPF